MHTDKCMSMRVHTLRHIVHRVMLCASVLRTSKVSLLLKTFSDSAKKSWEPSHAVAMQFEPKTNFATNKYYLLPVVMQGNISMFHQHKHL